MSDDDDSDEDEADGGAPLVPRRTCSRQSSVELNSESSGACACRCVGEELGGCCSWELGSRY